MHSSALFETAVRVLGHCANNQHPAAGDIDLLRRCVPHQNGMNLAELAGIVIWKATH